MATSEGFMEFIVEQAEGAGHISTKRMFGAYCLYCDEKPVAFIGENSVFVKPTEKGRAFIGDVTEGELFPGSKLWFIIEERFEERDWFSELIRLTAGELPQPKPRKPRAGKKKYLMN
jgi:TfoX/Sxy family transcriptional regulator of competence genes